MPCKQRRSRRSPRDLLQTIENDQHGPAKTSKPLSATARLEQTHLIDEHHYTDSGDSVRLFLCVKVLEHLSYRVCQYKPRETQV